MDEARTSGNITSLGVIDEKLNGLGRLIEEKFMENTNGHQAIWEQVKATNGRLRLVEKVVWSIGGACVVLALIFSPSAVSALVALLR